MLGTNTLPAKVQAVYFASTPLKGKLINHCFPTVGNKQLLKKIYWKMLTN
jgi:hypothetical protein